MDLHPHQVYNPGSNEAQESDLVGQEKMLTARLIVEGHVVVIYEHVNGIFRACLTLLGNIKTPSVVSTTNSWRFRSTYSKGSNAQESRKPHEYPLQSLRFG